MNKITYLPGFRTAPPDSVRMIYAPDGSFPADWEAESVTKAATAGYTLERKRECALNLGKLVGGGQVFQETPSSWDNLIDQTDSWLSQHIDSRDLMGYDALSPRSTTLPATERHVKTVARDAAVAIGAYFKVIPQVLMNREFDDPNRDIAEYARRSMGFVLEWAGLHDQVDKPLAYALSALPKPPSQDNIYSGSLHFAPKWFKDEQGYIILDPVKAANLCDDTHHTHPTKSDSGVLELFGCPGRHMIPTLYRTMLDGAIDGNLFAETYHNERADHGYTEYHEAQLEEGVDLLLALR